jgi:hypothetical protein
VPPTPTFTPVPPTATFTPAPPTPTFTPVPPNRPPDCTVAWPSVGVIWPPNHRLVAVGILGVADPEGHPISITIDSIYQDEPVDTFGDGHSAPDGRGLGTAKAQVRAERSGSWGSPGNGRVYHILFTADDAHGGTCSGRVLVAVPKSEGSEGAAVDDGPLYDSTVATLWSP